MNPEHQVQKDYAGVENLCLINVPKKNVKERPPVENIEVIDPSHVMYCHVFSPGIDRKPIKWIDGEECNFKTPKLEDNGQCQTVKISTDYLRKALDNMDCDTVEISVMSDYPIKLHGVCGRVKTFDCTVIIAPRIDNE